jgi:MFS family permease
MGRVIVLTYIGWYFLSFIASFYRLILVSASLQGSFLLLFGRLADLHGRRLTFLAGIAWFTIFSIGCGSAHNQISLDVMRAFQGLGIAASLPAAMGILAQSFERGSTIRTVAFGTFSSGAPIGAALGTSLGAVLTQLSRYVYFLPFSCIYWVGLCSYRRYGNFRQSWRSPFYFTAGLGALTFVIGLVAIDKDTHCLNPDLDRRVDWIGAALITSGLVLFTFAIGDGETAPHGWKTGCEHLDSSLGSTETGQR